MNIFPPIEINQTEEDIIAKCLSNPSVIKYFHKLAYDVGVQITLATPAGHPSDEHYLRVIAGAQGQLAVLNTLLEISKPAEQQPSQ